MKLFAIADLHLSLGTDKPMDSFPGWHDYVSRLERGWKAVVGEEDTVVIAGRHFLGNVAGGGTSGFCVYSFPSRQKAAAQGQSRLLVDHPEKNGRFFCHLRF